MVIFHKCNEETCKSIIRIPKESFKEQGTFGQLGMDFLIGVGGQEFCELNLMEVLRCEDNYGRIAVAFDGIAIL